jgi:hypothetical protein
LAAKGEFEASSSVNPSGAARTTSIVPMTPFPPALLSTMKVWPKMRDICSVSTRVTWSLELPAGNGTTTRMLRP